MATGADLTIPETNNNKVSTCRVSCGLGIIAHSQKSEDLKRKNAYFSMFREVGILS